MKTKAFWIARDFSDAPSGCNTSMFWVKPAWMINRYIATGNYSQYIGSFANAELKRFTGISLKPGECKQFKLVEVKGR